MTNILVTGGAGFIGSSLIKELINLKFNIICVDNFDDFYSKSQKLYNINPLLNNPNFNLIETDITGEACYEKIKNVKIDCIIHIAAKAGVRPSIIDPYIYESVNYLGTLRMLEFAKNNKIPKFIFASSSSVYGVNENIPWVESDYKLKPISPYAATKIGCETLCYTYSKLTDIKFVALRFFTVYGPSQRPDLAIHKFAKKLFYNEPIDLYGDGSTKRDYTYIDDIVSGVIASLNYEKSNFEIFNLGNNYIIPLSNLISNIEEVFQKKFIINYLPEQQGDVSITYANIEKAKKELGYNPHTSLKDGLIEFKKWFLNYYKNI